MNQGIKRILSAIGLGNMFTQKANQAADHYTSPTFKPEFAAVLANIEKLAEDESKIILAGALAFTKEEPSQEELEAIIKACPLIVEVHPERKNAVFCGAIQKLHLNAMTILKIDFNVETTMNTNYFAGLNPTEDSNIKGMRVDG